MHKKQHLCRPFGLQVNSYMYESFTLRLVVHIDFIFSSIDTRLMLFLSVIYSFVTVIMVLFWLYSMLIHLFFQLGFFVGNKREHDLGGLLSA